MDIGKKVILTLVKGCLTAIASLPLNYLYLLGDCCYPIVRCYRKKVVRANLLSSFPEKSIQEIKDIERRFYHYFCDLAMETLKTLAISKEEMMRRMTFSGLETPAKKFSAGRTNLFVFMGHFGNWEWVASLQHWTTSFCNCAQIYHPLSNEVIDQLFLDMRNQYGGECIPMKVAVRTLLRQRAEGQKVLCGFISDQQPKWENIHHFTPFLHHDTAVFTGGEQIGKKMNAMMYYGHMTRPKRGYYNFELIPIAINPAPVPDYEITDRYMQMLEADINTHPELWLWTHKRWSRTKEEWMRRQEKENKNKES